MGLEECAAPSFVDLPVVIVLQELELTWEGEALARGEALNCDHDYGIP